MEKFVTFFVLLAIAFSTVQGAPHEEAHHDREEEHLEYLHDREFHLWLYEYYDGGKEHWADIYHTWRKNADYVKEHNSLGHLSYKLSLNKFAHKNISDMIKPEYFPHHHKYKKTHYEKHPTPHYVDWHKKGFIPPVKDREEHGDSYLYPFIDAFYAMWYISHHHESHHRESYEDYHHYPSFKEFKDCCWKEEEHHYWNHTRFECIHHHGGLAKAEDYKSPDHECLSHSHPAYYKLNGASFVKPKDEKALEIAVAYQPIAVAFDASHESFQFYKEGIYYEPDCSSEYLNHALLLVGYGEFEGKKYWIAKNSWGEKWGKDGFIYIAKDRDNHCGIASRAFYPY